LFVDECCTSTLDAHHRSKYTTLKKKAWVCVSAQYRDQTRDIYNRYIANYADFASLFNTSGGADATLGRGPAGQSARTLGELQYKDTYPEYDRLDYLMIRASAETRGRHEAWMQCVKVMCITAIHSHTDSSLTPYSHTPPFMH
jgi:hypothetical protein